MEQPIVDSSRTPEQKPSRYLPASSVPVVGTEATIAEVESLLLKTAVSLETIRYIYIVDHEKKLRGVISIKEVFRSPKHIKVSEVMKREITSVRPHTEQERVALLAIEHNLKAIPVVDAEDRLLGVYPSDVILNILHQESIEDFLRFAGIHRFTDPAKSIITANAWTLIKKRLPWLLVGLLGGLIGAFIVHGFTAALETELLLAAFIPAVAYIADAVGTQTQTIFIRTLSINRALKINTYIWRETKVGIGLTLILSLLSTFLVSILWSSSLGLIIGLAFLATILVAIAIAIGLPLLFFRMHIDPAIASGPFATVIRDILSLIIYFVIANAILHSGFYDKGNLFPFLS